jgi:hypothetical protein
LCASLHAEVIELRNIAPDKKTPEEKKREGKLIRQRHNAYMLLAAMLNRLGVKITGEVSVQHGAATGGDVVVIPPDALGGFATMRAEVAANNRVAALTGGKN